MTTRENEKKYPRLFHWLNVAALVGGEAFIVGLTGMMISIGENRLIGAFIWGGLGLLVSAMFLYWAIFVESE